MPLKLYHLFVNRNYTVKKRYEQFVLTHRKLHRFRIPSLFYLIWLNFCFRILHLPDRKRVRLKNESGTGNSRTAQEIAEILCKSDVVSFDMFDTLILRPLDSPPDVFYIVGEKLDIPDFRNIRQQAEVEARRRHMQQYGNAEVSLSHIYTILAEWLHISETSAEIEIRTEQELCLPNPFMSDVWNRVLAAGKTIVVTTDMYLPEYALEAMLQKCGFSGYDTIFLSNVYGYGKYNGKLYENVKAAYPEKQITHIGDNPHADAELAEKAGIHSVLYPNVQEHGRPFRPDRMSFLIGSAYRGLVNRRMYCMESCSPAFEFGYKYGGLLLLGFCGFIHEQALQHHADKILFFSRDGYIVRKLYQKLYPEERTEYVYWSRAAAAKLCVKLYPQDYFRRFLDQKVNRDIPLSEILKAMDLSDLQVSFPTDVPLTDMNLAAVKAELNSKLDTIDTMYSGMYAYANQYFTKMLKECHSAVTVDCGWAGSGHILLDAYLNRKAGLSVNMTGLLAGSNACHQYDSDFSETYFRTGKLISYCFSAEHNRECYETHFPAAKHNIYFELLFGAAQPSFTGFTESGPAFDTESENKTFTEEVHAGELAFADDYLKAFAQYPYMKRISGSDAYAPFLAAISGRKAYLTSVFQNCVFDETVSGRKEKV